MVYDPSMLDRIEAIGHRPFDRFVWRHMFNDMDPARANTRGARWNPARDSRHLHQPGKRNSHCRSRPRNRTAATPTPRHPATSRDPTSLLTVDLALIGLVGSLGVSDADVASPGHAACQNAGGACHWLGADGILVPSDATLPASTSWPTSIGWMSTHTLQP